jgi:hypothetical protein
MVCKDGHRHFETHEYSGYTLREVEIDVHLDAGPKTTIIWKLSGDDDRQQERVMSLIQKLAPDSYDKYAQRRRVATRTCVERAFIIRSTHCN